MFIICCRELPINPRNDFLSTIHLLSNVIYFIIIISGIGCTCSIRSTRKRREQTADATIFVEYVGIFPTLNMLEYFLPGSDSRSLTFVCSLPFL